MIYAGIQVYMNLFIKAHVPLDLFLEINETLTIQIYYETFQYFEAMI